MTLERTPGVLLQHCEVDLDASDLHSWKPGDRPHARVTARERMVAGLRRHRSAADGEGGLS